MNKWSKSGLISCHDEDDDDGCTSSSALSPQRSGRSKAVEEEEDTHLWTQPKTLNIQVFSHVSWRDTIDKPVCFHALSLFGLFFQTRGRKHPKYIFKILFYCTVSVCICRFQFQSISLKIFSLTHTNLIVLFLFWRFEGILKACWYVTLTVL